MPLPNFAFALIAVAVACTALLLMRYQRVSFEVAVLHTVAACVLVLAVSAFLLDHVTKLVGHDLGFAIGGTVTDYAGEPIGGASVQVVNPASSSAHLVQTNTNGSFVLPRLASDVYEVQVQAIGFKPVAHKMVKVSADVTISIQLERVEHHAPAAGQSPNSRS